MGCSRRPKGGGIVQRYFVTPDAFQGDTVSFIGEDFHHMTRVLRLRAGDRVIACDGSGRDALVQIVSITSDHVVAQIVHELAHPRELSLRITLAQGLAKGEKMDVIVQKATELGAHAIVPFTSTRTIVKLDDKKERQRLARWHKIAKEAAEQAHGSRIPHIGEVVSFSQLVASGSTYDMRLLAYENEQQYPISAAMDELSATSTVLLVIGPEGGFSEDEVQLAVQHGFTPVSLGRRILRTETASIAALAILGHRF